MDHDISNELLQEWQSIVDLIASIMGVTAGLIMRINEDDIEVFVASNTKNNPYTVGDKEYLPGSGLYCETVINQQGKLHVLNALKSEKWRNNPDIKLNMISYLGFPINSPNGVPFGTICVLDDKEKEYSPDLVELLEKMGKLIESHLELVANAQIIKRLAETDHLTKILNRRAIENGIEQEIERAIRYEQKISVLLLDVDLFKAINDGFGHQAGDAVLVELTKQISSVLRKTDLFGRFGGDEFIVVMPETDIELAQIVGERILSQLRDVNISNKNLNYPVLSVSIGISEFVSGDTLTTMISRADKALYRSKETGRNKMCIEKI